MVMILSFWTDRCGQTEDTDKQFDLGLHCLGIEPCHEKNLSSGFATS